MDNLRLNDIPAVRIAAKLIKQGPNTVLMDCEGDEVWFPKKHIEIEKEQTMLIEEWLYNAKVSKGEL